MEIVSDSDRSSGIIELEKLCRVCTQVIHQETKLFRPSDYETKVIEYWREENQDLATIHIRDIGTQVVVNIIEHIHLLISGDKIFIKWHDVLVLCWNVVQAAEGTLVSGGIDSIIHARMQRWI